MLPASALLSAPLNCRNAKPNEAPRQPTSLSASTSRPMNSALLLVQPPGLAPPATTTLVSASHRPPRLMPQSSLRPSVRPSQPVPVEWVVAAGLPLTAGGDDCACTWPAQSVSDASTKAATLRIGRMPTQGALSKT